jgi:hypothetical protein
MHLPCSLGAIHKAVLDCKIPNKWSQHAAKECTKNE